jgi:hypothetical protein
MVLVASGYQPGARAESVSFRQMLAGVPLRGANDVALSIMHWFRIVASGASRRSWDTSTVGYSYELLGAGGRELFAFHWHPDSRSPITFPHVHVNAQIAEFDLSKMHIPTGVLTLPEIVRFAIEELGVEPLRDDWRAALGIA